jgi:hypothetical protein
MNLEIPRKPVCVFLEWTRLLLLLSLLAAFLPAQQAQPLKPDNVTKEDWTTLSIGGLSWQSYPPMPGGTVERPEFTRELVRLQWRVGDPVDVVVVRPHGVAKPRVVLYLYGYPSDMSRFMFDQWSKTATEGGFAAVGFVSALTGDRYRNRPMKEWFVSEMQESLGTTTHDVQMVLNYLEKRGDLNMDRVGMYGEGSGAAIAILAASADPRIAVLDLMDPWGDWADWLKQSPLVPEKEREAYLSPEFLDKVANLDPVRILPRLTTQVIRLQQVKAYRITPPSVAEKIAAAVPPKAQLLQSEDWASYRKTWEEKKIWNWVKDQLEALPVRTAALPAGELRN